MSESPDKQSVDCAPRKRCPSPEQSGKSPVPSKLAKADGTAGELPFNSRDNKNEDVNDPVSAETTKQNGKEMSELCLQTGQEDESSAAGSVNPVSANSTEKAQAPLSETRGPGAAKVDTVGTAATADYCRPSTSMDQSDSAAIAAAEALASLTRGDANEKSKESPGSSRKVAHEKQGNKVKRSYSVKDRSRHETEVQARAAAADSSTSVRVDREETEDMPDEDDEDDSLPGTSSPGSSFQSDYYEDYDDGECAIVSVVMAPNIRKSLERVQMKLDELERKSARIDQISQRLVVERSSITQRIPGFWVTALKHHPGLSEHIEQTDEEALSYMTDLEIKTFKNHKYRIRFHFGPNSPHFQNQVLMKEFNLGGGSIPVSFSNPIMWRHEQNPTTMFARSFFNWFTNHRDPGHDDIAKMLKEDLHRNPLRYYLNPPIEPWENGSSSSGVRGAERSSSSQRDECVVISSGSEEEPDEPGRDHNQDDDDEIEEDYEDDYDDQRGRVTGRGHSNDDEDGDDDDDDEDDDEDQRGSVGGSDSEGGVGEEEVESDGEKDEELDEELDVDDTDTKSPGGKAAVRPQEENQEDVEADGEGQN